MEDGALPPRWGEYARRMPSSLDDLKGPATGRVELPLHVAWSGRRVYDVGQDDQRLVLYALLLAEAQREDLERFVHRESLVSMWPRLRRLLGGCHRHRHRQPGGSRPAAWCHGSAGVTGSVPSRRVAGLTEALCHGKPVGGGRRPG